MYIDKVGIGTSPGLGANPVPGGRGAPPSELKARSRQPVDTVEISDSARANAEAEVERVGLLPQLVVRLTGRLRAAFFDRPEVTQEAGVDGSVSPGIPAYEGRPSDLGSHDPPAAPPAEAAPSGP